MSAIIADTHVIVWYLSQIENLSQTALQTNRIIAATALTLNLPLVTCDRKIRACSIIQTIWYQAWAIASPN